MHSGGDGNGGGSNDESSHSHEILIKNNIH